MRKNKNEYRLHAERLISDADWRNAGIAFGRIEKAAVPNPWTTWRHFDLVRKLVYPDSPYWYVVITENGLPIAATVYREEISRRNGLPFKALRSVDWSAACMPAIVSRLEYKESMPGIFISLLGELHRRTGAHLLCLSQISESYCGGLVNYLDAANIPHKRVESTRNQMINLKELKDDSSLNKKIRNLRRNDKNILEETKQQAHFVRLRGDVWEEMQSKGYWEQYLRLWRKSWQSSYHDMATEHGAVQGLNYLMESLPEWSRRGWLDLCLYMAGDTAVASYMNLIVNDRLWLLTTYYDDEYSRFSVGSSVLLSSILDSRERGDLCMNFGGEAIEWKKRWANLEEPVYRLELGLGGALGLAWKIQQRRRRQCERAEEERLHKIQSRKDYEKMLAGQDGTPGESAETLNCLSEPRATLLDTEDKWQSVKDRIEKLGKKSKLNPWSGWAHYHELWKAFFTERRVWLLELPSKDCENAETVAATFLMEEQEKRGPIVLKKLRSLDQMAMRIPSLIIASGMEEKAACAFSASLRKISRLTGCDYISLYRQEAEGIEVLSEALKSKGVTFEKRIFTYDQCISMPENYEDYHNSLSSLILGNIDKKYLRKINRDYPEAFEMEFRRFSPSNIERLASMWAEFDELRRRSWQYENTETKGLADTNAVSEYFRQAAGIWAERGILDLCLMRLGGKCTAGLLGLSTPDKYFALLTAYDRDYKLYGCGLMALHELLKQAHARGDRQITLGGEGSSWKVDWAPLTEAVYQLEFSLGSIKGELRCLLKRLKGTSSENPVR